VNYQKTIAIDFDGTIAENNYPKVGKLFKDVKEQLFRLKDAGYNLIVHTVRANPVWCKPEDLIAMAECIKENDLPIDYIWMGQGKPMAEYYIDDRGEKFTGDWVYTVDQILGKAGNTQKSVRPSKSSVMVLVDENVNELDILKAIDQLGELGDFEINIRKAITKTEFEYWFLEKVFNNNQLYFDQWKQRLYQDLQTYLGRKKIFPLNEAEYQGLKKFLEPYRQALVHNMTGWELDKTKMNQLAKNNLIDPNVLKYPEISYKLGMLHDYIQQEQGKWKSESAFFKHLVKRAQEIDLSDIDKRAIRSAINQAHGYLSPTAENLINGGLKSLYQEEAEINQQIAAALEKREHPFITGRHLRNELTKQGYNRDWERVSRTEIAKHYNEGAFGELTEKLKKFNKDLSKVELYRIASPGACEVCRELFSHEDGTPKRYKYTTFLANGSNRGKQQADWKAVIEPVHPNCRCAVASEAIPGITDLTYPNMFKYKLIG